MLRLAADAAVKQQQDSPNKEQFPVADKATYYDYILNHNRDIFLLFDRSSRRNQQRRRVLQESMS